ncbi:hypothetical protein ACN28E_40500 [Archangium lansingense]|uniref:hypothetical protein n=1 Tax=Archangium lansingense TaxID=2995310 RepID=UPI003B7E1344
MAHFSWAPVCFLPPPLFPNPLPSTLPLFLFEPLQPHGPLHPAAFVEVLRELVRERKYQVILSTRDKALAEGMRRKMVAAGIDCVTCRYGGLGPASVLYNAV